MCLGILGLLQCIDMCQLNLSACAVIHACTCALMHLHELGPSIQRKPATLLWQAGQALAVAEVSLDWWPQLYLHGHVMGGCVG